MIIIICSVYGIFAQHCSLAEALPVVNSKIMAARALMAANILHVLGEILQYLQGVLKVIVARNTFGSSIGGQSRRERVYRTSACGPVGL